MQSRVLWRSRGAAAERAVSVQAKTPCKGGLNSPRSRAHCSRRPSARSDRIRRQSCDCRAMRRRERNAPSRTGARLGLLWPHSTWAHSIRSRQGANVADSGATWTWGMSPMRECRQCTIPISDMSGADVRRSLHFYTANFSAADKIHPHRNPVFHGAAGGPGSSMRGRAAEKPRCARGALLLYCEAPAMLRVDLKTGTLE
jgi:hypothetical protein